MEAWKIAAIAIPAFVAGLILAASYTIWRFSDWLAKSRMRIKPGGNIVPQDEELLGLMKDLKDLRNEIFPPEAYDSQVKHAPNIAHLDLDLRKYVEDGYTYSEIWVLRPRTMRPPGAHTIPIGDGYRLAFRHTKENEHAVHDTGSERGPKQVA